MKKNCNRIAFFAVTIRRVRTFYIYKNPTTDIIYTLSCFMDCSDMKQLFHPQSLKLKTIVKGDAPTSLISTASGGNAKVEVKSFSVFLPEIDATYI